MAESLQVENVSKATLLEASKVFPGLKWRVNRGTGEGTVYDAKKDEWVTLSDGDFIVSIADRFEVHDKEPAKAHPVELPDEEPEDSDTSEDNWGADD
jgi:hypothetical protein